MNTLSIDIETYSHIDLTRSGVYPYAASPEFEILLFAYAVDQGEVEIVDLAQGEEIPEEIIAAIKDDTVIKRAFNANFERVCLSTYFKVDLKADSWRCTAVQSAALGLPLSLKGVASALRLNIQKMEEGKDLIKYFTMPCKGVNINGGSTRNYPQDHKVQWNLFKEYCKRDVQVERAISKRLIKFPLSDVEQEIYVLDQEINHRGILVDLNLVRNAMECDDIYRGKALNTARDITGLSNPNSPAQLKKWLQHKGVKVDSLSRKTVEELTEDIKEELKNYSEEPGEHSEEFRNKTLGQVLQVLNLRLHLSKTSIKKYEAIQRTVCKDHRVRGLFQFNGASRTGRWVGRLVQVQNLPRNHLKDIEVARDLVKEGNFQALELLYDNVPGVLSELIRTAFIPKENHSFIVADFSAIEARVLAWLAGEQWRVQVFETHGKIYEASASKMFNVDIEEITKTSPVREKGKIAELALGYGGSVTALKTMGALNMGVNEEELQTLVDTWRAANPRIVKFWWDINSAVVTAIKTRLPQQVGRIKIYCAFGSLFITLPSGRRLSYINPQVHIGTWGKAIISYEGITASKKWGKIESYGPKFVENIVQGISRDIFAQAMVKLKKSGYQIVLHVHDEVVVEVPKLEDVVAQGEEFRRADEEEPQLKNQVEEICQLITETPKWATGLKLKAEGFQCEFYRK